MASCWKMQPGWEEFATLLAKNLEKQQPRTSTKDAADPPHDPWSSPPRAKSPPSNVYASPKINNAEEAMFAPSYKPFDAFEAESVASVNSTPPRVEKLRRIRGFSKKVN